MAGEPLAEQSGGFDKGRWPVRLCLPGNDFWLFDEKGSSTDVLSRFRGHLGACDPAR
jgi:hypothetical protein